MASISIPLSVLDLVPIASGSSVAESVARTVDLAQRAEQAGYHRYWIAEHHLNPGVAGSVPPLLINLVAGATSRIRVGSGAVQMGHQTPLSVVEAFGLLDALHPGRIDLGLGRSGPRRLSGQGPRPGDGQSRTTAERELVTVAPSPATRTAGPAGGGPEAFLAPDRHPDAARDPADPLRDPALRVTDKGLVIPPRFSFSRLLGSPRFALQARLLQQAGAEAPDYDEQVDEVQRLLEGRYQLGDATAQAVPGQGASIELWIMGSSGGESARVAGSRGLPFGANYHVSPGTVLEAVASYRAAFRPSSALPHPKVLVSADVVVADDEATARHLASGYGLWVRSIRLGLGAIPFPTPEQAAAHTWTDDDRDLVADRIATQFVGSPEAVADQLEVLAEETGADELLVTTITHDHQARARSFDLLAAEWKRRAQDIAAVVR